MANVEAPVQDLGQNPFIYGYGARPIQQPKADTSGEIMGKTIGSALGEGGKLLEAGSKMAFNTESQAIKENMHAQYDPIQDNFISRLTRVDDVLKRSGDPDNLINNYSGTYPEDIKKLPGTVDQLISLRDNGHVSETYIDMQKDSIAKNLRAKYGSGMRDVIDGEFSRMTREDPANKVVAQLTQDINTYAAQAKSQRDKVSNQVLHAVTQGIVPYSAYQQVLANPNAAPEIMSKIYAHAKAHLDLQDDDLRLRNEAANRTLNKDRMTDRNGTALDKLVGITASNLEIDVPGMSHAHINDVLNNIDKYDDATKIKIAQVFRQAGLNFATQARNYGQRPINPDDPNSPTRASFDPNYDKTIESKRKYFEDMADLILKDKVGLAYSSSQFLQATMSTAGVEAVKNIPGMAAFAELAKLAPNSPQLNKFLQGLLTDPQVQSDMHAYTTSSFATAVTQPNVTSSGVPFTMGNALDDAARKNIEGPAASAIISGVKQVLNDPSAPIELRQNAATFLYGDPNAISKVNTSVVQDGQVGGGKSTLLAATVNAQTTQAVKKLGNPEYTQKYIEFAKKSTWLTLAPEIEQLSKMASNPQMQIGYDSDHNQFFVNPNLTPEQRRAGIRVPQEMKSVQDSVTKINLALRSLIDVSSKLTHESVPDFLAQFFVESGMDPELIRNTIGGQFINALINANKKPEPRVQEIAD